VVDAPRNEMMTTALVINVDQAQSEIVALIHKLNHRNHQNRLKILLQIQLKKSL
jgi:hypothetical protein